MIAGPLQASYGGVAIGVLLAGFGLLAVVCGLVLPETKHRSLEVTAENVAVRVG